MKIAILEPLAIPQEKLAAYVSGLEREGHTVVCWPDRPASGEEIARRVGDSDIAVITNTKFPGEAILAAPNLKMIDVAFTGIDHIDAEACRKKGVTVCNASGYSTEAVAELVIGLAIGCLRRVPAHDRATREGRDCAGFLGREIAGKTVGIVGTGAIGIRTAALFRAFGAKVVAYSRTVRQEALDLGVTYLPLDEVFARSDIVSLHVPANASTRHMIGEAQFACARPGLVLINAARGPVVDSRALAGALASGKVAAAGLDVFDKEPPLDPADPLLESGNTVLTPHIAYRTAEAMELRAGTVFENIRRYAAGAPQNVCVL